MTPARAAWLTIGFAALVLAILGVALPLLPTTPFLLVAAFAFARSSDRWHRWLREHRVFGPLIADWQEHGAIDRRTKLLSVLAMAAAMGAAIAMNASPTVLGIQAVVLTCAAAFVLSRPSPPEG
ncbi:MAG: YbaN family protein [Rhodospirillaceae bacterium]|jgi:uncharacterized protein|nr:YbaN family protein [Rhodospirillaceae bacterium]MBT6512544.1 YbaN family protein [Rhodospirillaceae bacterium]